MSKPMTDEQRANSMYTKEDGTWVRGRAAAKLKRDKEQAELDQVNETRKKYGFARPHLVANTKDETREYPVQYWMEICKVGKVDFQKPEDVRDRSEWWLELTFEHGVAPSVAQYASALGISRQLLYAIVMNRPAKYPTETLDILDRYYHSIDGMLENLAASGQIQSVPWIFQSKNNFGYRDQVEHVVVADRHDDSPERLVAEAEMLGLDDGSIEGEGTVK